MTNIENIDGAAPHTPGREAADAGRPGSLAPLFSLRRAPRAALLQLALLASLLWCGAAAALAMRPPPTLDDARGLYASEGGPFRWTSSQALFPIRAGGALSRVTLGVASGSWPNRPPPLVSLSADGQALARFTPSDRPRLYHLLLPGSARELRLTTSVDRPSQADRRWLGVRVYHLDARSPGLPSRAATQALAATPALLLVALGLRWCAARGWGAAAALAAFGLLLRVYDLDRLPAGFFQDEAVSLIDAWSVAHTGRDHLGNVLPLGAFESFGDWVSPLMTYLEVPSVLLFGTTPLAGRLVVAVAGAIAVPVVFAIARFLSLPKSGALCAALVAAVSPWQIMRSRVAGPPSMALLCWALCVLAALAFVRRPGRREALLLALAAGIGLYSYPTMKLAVPLLAGLAALLAFGRELAGDPATGEKRRWAAVAGRLLRRWWPAGALLAALWLPFAQLTLLNEHSAMRASHKIIRADTAGAWAAEWAASYSVYLRPEFYFISGDASNGMPGQGVELPIEAPLALAGLAWLLWRSLGRGARADEWRLVLGAVLIAPLPASLMTPNPHLSRALIAAPLFALLVGMGLAALWGAARRLRPPLPLLVGGALLAAIAWQGALRYQDYRQSYPRVVERKYQDGLREAVERAVAYAPQFDEVWVDGRVSFPYVYVLAAQAMSPEEMQATIAVERPRTTFNTVTRVGPYRFTSLKEAPADLPVLESFVTSLGEPAYLLQAWEQGGRRVLVLRKM